MTESSSASPEQGSSSSTPSKGPGLPLPGHEGEEVEFERTIPARTDRLHGRTRERIRAIDVLFEADARRAAVLDVLGERRARVATQTPLPQRAIALVEMYAPHAEEIDEQLETHSRDWQLHRMPAVDRAILRLGAAEILHEVPEGERGAVIGEYTKVAEALSTESSPRFVNGLLQRLVDMEGLLGTD